MSEATQLMNSLRGGEQSAADRLLPLVYDELRRLAATKLRYEAPGQTLNATALVHEAYLRLVGSDTESNWDSRGHFFAAAAEAMRRILVEKARRKKRLKHGGGRNRLNWEESASLVTESAEHLMALDEALGKLSAEDPAKAEVVKLRFFAGLTMPEIALAMSISLKTTERHWTYARTWLYAELKDRDGESFG